MMNKYTTLGSARGYTLIEVLVGILIFAVGMMALAQLQTNLAQNSGDASARTVAMNYAEELIETDRTFKVLESNGVDYAYNDIVDETTSEVRSGTQFTISRMSPITTICRVRERSPRRHRPAPRSPISRRSTSR
jgi:type IV pilus modification protein PilV